MARIEKLPELNSVFSRQNPASSVQNSCPSCHGTGWKPVEGEDARTVQRCDCWYDATSSRFMVEARLPKRYEHCDLDNFLAYNESLRRAVDKARELAEAFPVVERGLLLLGLPGVGKTHLAVAILKHAIRARRAHGLYYDTRELLRVIRSTYDPVVRTTEAEVLRPVMEAELLVLDDLGAEKTSEWVDETMNLIVNTRYNERRVTIFTSNYQDSPDDTDLESLTFRIGFRMRSRLFEMCDIVEIDAGDYRQRPANADEKDLQALWEMRRRRPGKRTLPARAGRPARAQLREDDSELKWPGGKAGSS